MGMKQVKSSGLPIKGTPVVPAKKERTAVSYAKDTDVIFVPGVGEITVGDLKAKALAKVVGGNAPVYIRSVINAIAKEGTEVQTPDGAVVTYYGVLKPKRINEILSEVAKAMGMKRRIVGISRLMKEDLIRRVAVKGVRFGLSPLAKGYLDEAGTAPSGTTELPLDS